MNILKAVSDIAEEIDVQGAPRFWVNDSGVEVDIKLDYGHSDQNANLETEFKAVGLVDEKDGGMIAYGKPAIMEDLADKLNQLDIIERIINAQD